MTTPNPITTLTDETRALLTDVEAHAAACGRLDCGHLGRSTSQAVRRAVFLYQAEGAGLILDLDRVSADVAAVVGVLRTSQHGRTTYTRGTTASGGRGYVPIAAGLVAVLPNADGIKITPQRRDVFTDMLYGHSATQIAARTHRTLETVKSHAGYLRRLTGAHDAHSALIALVLAGKLHDRALTVPTDDES